MRKGAASRRTPAARAPKVRRAVVGRSKPAAGATAPRRAIPVVAAVPPPPTAVEARKVPRTRKRAVPRRAPAVRAPKVRRVVVRRSRPAAAVTAPGLAIPAVAPVLPPPTKVEAPKAPRIRKRPSVAVPSILFETDAVVSAPVSAAGGPGDRFALGAARLGRPAGGAERVATVMGLDAGGERMREGAGVAATEAVRFATIPVDLPLGEVLAAVRSAVPFRAPLGEVLADRGEGGFDGLPVVAKTRVEALAVSAEAPPSEPAFDGRVQSGAETAHEVGPSRETSPGTTPGTSPAVREVGTRGTTAGATGRSVAGLVPAPAWTPAQERALEEVTEVDAVRRVWVGSLDMTELVRQQLAGAPGAAPGAVPGVSSPAAGFGAPVSAGPEAGGVSSAALMVGQPGPRRGFWFNVNAELVIYGATEPDAALTVAGRRVRLRQDGSFSLRFALPDGEYGLRVEAVSKGGDDGRSAALDFSRRSEYAGAVGVHPQDARLRPPQGEHVGEGFEAGGAG